MKNHSFYLFLFIVSFAVRLVFALFFPMTGGDADIYTTVSENILRGCGVSLSNPQGAECMPHFGGNQLPGLPFFIASIWFLFSHSDVAVRVAQAFLVSISVGFLAHAVCRFTENKRIAFTLGLVIALSPLEVAWSRYLQTEALALATTIWVIAEILLSLTEHRMRILRLSLAVSAAYFIRLDGILLCLPVLILAFSIKLSCWHAIRQYLIFLLLIVIPFALWTARNIHVGLPSLVPPPMVLPNNASPPLGYIFWGWTWISEEYQRPGWGFGVTRFVYDSISIDEKAFASPEEKNRVDGLVKDLQAYQGQPFPKHIDEEFALLARERIQRAPFRSFVILPMKRISSLWSNPYCSFGWPNEMPSTFSYDEHLQLVRGGIAGKITVAMKYPFRALSKAFTGGYRFLLIVATVASLAYSVRMPSPLKHAVWICFSIVLARTLFLAMTNNVETRYTVEAVPAMELAAVLAFYSWHCSNKTAKGSIR